MLPIRIRIWCGTPNVKKSDRSHCGYLTGYDFNKMVAVTRLLEGQRGSFCCSIDTTLSCPSIEQRKAFGGSAQPNLIGLILV
jgi:hypothetical protein